MAISYCNEGKFHIKNCGKIHFLVNRYSENYLKNDKLMKLF